MIDNIEQLIVELQRYDPKSKVGGIDDMGCFEPVNYIERSREGKVMIIMMEGDE